MENNICFIDFETTGLNLIKDYPIEIGAVLVDSNLDIIKKFQSYIKPTNSFEIEAPSFNIHGISEEIVMSAPSELSVLTSMFAELGTNYRIAAWNMSFDLSFFKAWCYRNSFGKILEEINYRHIDVQTICFIAKEMGCISENINSLSQLLTYFGFTRSKYHNALEDAELLYRVYVLLIKKLKELGLMI